MLITLDKNNTKNQKPTARLSTVQHDASFPSPVRNKPPDHLGSGLAAWQEADLPSADPSARRKKLPEIQLQDLSTQPQALYKPRVT